MKMSHALTATTMPIQLRTSSMSRPKPSLINLSPPLSPLTRSQPLSFNGGLLSGLSHQQPLPLAHAVSGLPSVDLRDNLGLDGFLEIELKVRDYEVDQYGVVNNAVYSSYCQHAHHELLESHGVNLETSGRSHPIAVSDLSFKFLAPLRNREKFILKVRMSHSTVARIFVEHYIFKLPNYEPILEAKSTLVWLDKNHRPVRIPSELKFKLTQSRLSK